VSDLAGHAPPFVGEGRGAVTENMNILCLRYWLYQKMKMNKEISTCFK